DTGLSIQGDELQGNATAAPGDYTVQVYAHNAEGDSVGPDYKTEKATLYHLQIKEKPSNTGYLLCPEGKDFTVANGKAKADTTDSFGYSYHFESISQQKVYDGAQLDKLSRAQIFVSDKRLLCVYHLKSPAPDLVSVVAHEVPAVSAKDVKFTAGGTLCYGSRTDCQLQYDKAS
ncbi:MAG: hypothetical protein JW855_00120, partial [Gammaproteobacteria bacterium]|nr:hypothetical protein [Gammaproteobacteria bacterium]